MLRRATAIKIVRDADDPDTVARFEREVQLTSRLTHPNTVQVYDFGRAADGTFYYAMEHIEGLTLWQLVELDGPQSPGRVISLLVQICASLAEAHALGLIHRDVKPDNVLVCARGLVPDVVKVVDFGLARSIAAGGREVPGTIMGTAQYMAPEAVRGPRGALEGGRGRALTLESRSRAPRVARCDVVSVNVELYGLESSSVVVASYREEGAHVMNASFHEVVIDTLACYLNVDPLAIEGRQQLEHDWGLDVLDLTLLACRLEDALDIEIASGAIEHVKTVADVEALARDAPASLRDHLGLGTNVASSLREQVRRTPARTRRKWVHRQLRRTLRSHVA